MHSVIGSTRMSAKGQITIPVHIRHELGLAAGDAVYFLLDSTGNVVICGATLAALYEAQQALAPAAQSAHISRPEQLNRAIRRAQSTTSICNRFPPH